MTKLLHASQSSADDGQRQSFARSVDPLNHNRSIRVTGTATAQVCTGVHVYTREFTCIMHEAKGQRSLLLLLPYLKQRRAKSISPPVPFDIIGSAFLFLVLLLLLFLCPSPLLTPINARFFCCMSKISHYREQARSIDQSLDFTFWLSHYFADITNPVFGTERDYLVKWAFILKRFFWLKKVFLNASQRLFIPVSDFMTVTEITYGNFKSFIN